MLYGNFRKIFQILFIFNAYFSKNSYTFALEQYINPLFMKKC